MMGSRFVASGRIARASRLQPPRSSLPSTRTPSWPSTFSTSDGKRRPIAYCATVRPGCGKKRDRPREARDRVTATP
jgi:hypothetical protein